jgi:23S rRNA pseudouridine955/2504/2580 synthase
LLIAKNRQALLHCQDKFRQGQVEKEYLALTVGQWTQKSVSVRKALQKNTTRGGERMVSISPQGKMAVSHFQLLKQFRHCALVRVKIETGRTHQIRVHAAFLGHPVLGDDKYGDKKINTQYRQRGLKRMFLHAQQLSFIGENAPPFVAKTDSQWADAVNYLKTDKL